MYAPRFFVLQLECIDRDLANLMRECGQSCAAFVTAFNPASELVPEASNHVADAALRDKLKVLGRPFYRCVSRDPANVWPDELGYLVLGLAQAEVRSLGESFGQNAILWADADAVTRLVLLR